MDLFLLISFIIEYELFSMLTFKENIIIHYFINAIIIFSMNFIIANIIISIIMSTKDFIIMINFHFFKNKNKFS